MSDGGLHGGPGQIPDDELFAVVRDGSGRARAEREHAAGELFRRYHAKVRGWCLRILGDDQTAEDLTQAVFVELLEGGDPYRSRGRFGSWLYVMTRTRCLNELRARRRRREGDSDVDLADLLAADDDPGRDAELGQLRERIEEICRRRLSPREQEVVHLRYGIGLPVKEITAILGLTNASGARTHLRSAEEKLRRYLRSLRNEYDGG